MKNVINFFINIKIKVITLFVSQLHFQMFGLKPFNPILGETFQTKIGNTEIYIEQTSHHPPILNFYITNPKFKIFGFEQIEASTGANSVIATKNGKLFINMDDTLYKVTKPVMNLTGTTMGKRFYYFSEELIVEDLVIKKFPKLKNIKKPNIFYKLFT